MLSPHFSIATNPAMNVLLHMPLGIFCESVFVEYIPRGRTSVSKESILY